MYFLVFNIIQQPMRHPIRLTPLCKRKEAVANRAPHERILFGFVLQVIRKANDLSLPRKFLCGNFLLQGRNCSRRFAIRDLPLQKGFGCGVFSLKRPHDPSLLVILVGRLIKAPAVFLVAERKQNVLFGASLALFIRHRYVNQNFGTTRGKLHHSHVRIGGASV